MTLIRAAILAAILLAPAAAHAQKIDLATIKCKDFIESGKETIGYLIMWLDGYYSNEDDPAVVDFDALKKKGEELGAACAKNPELGLITVAEDIMSK